MTPISAVCAYRRLTLVDANDIEQEGFVALGSPHVDGEEYACSFVIFAGTHNLYTASANDTLGALQAACDMIAIAVKRLREGGVRVYYDDPRREWMPEGPSTLQLEADVDGESHAMTQALRAFVAQQGAP